MKTLLIAFLCFLTVVAVAQDGQLYMSVHDLTVISDEIIEGKVVSIRPKWDQRKRHIHTEITVQVEKSYKNVINEDEIILDELGGTVGEFTTFAPYQAQFQTFEKVLIFINRHENQYRIAGFKQGKFTLVTENGKETLKREISTNEINRMNQEQEIRNTYSYNEMIELIVNSLNR